MNGWFQKIYMDSKICIFSNTPESCLPKCFFFYVWANTDRPLLFTCFKAATRNAQLHQPRLWFITGGYLVKRWFLPAATRARGQSNDLNREILASNLFNCRKEVLNAPPVPSISRCIHIVCRHKNVWEYQWSNFIYKCLSTFLHYVCCKDALLDCSAPGGERCESLTRVDEIGWAIMPYFRVGKAPMLYPHLVVKYVFLVYTTRVMTIVDRCC